MSVLAPRDEVDLAECIASHGDALEPVGGGTKRAIGQPVEAALLDLAALHGVLDYRPDELVLTARAATRLQDVQQALAARGQRLAFEPPDFGALLGARADAGSHQTIGGVLAANLAGSRRLAAGAARDHFLGFRAVSGRGERFRAGGKVVKNVTGYDLPKLLAGSWGTLAVLTEVTVRAVPAAELERTLHIVTADPARAVALMTLAVGSPHDVSSAAWSAAGGVALRLEGFAPSVQARTAALIEALQVADVGQTEGDASREFWRHTGGAHALAPWPVVWRISVPPAHAVQVLRDLQPEASLLDWAGGLVWIGSSTVEAGRVRAAVRDGHATLLKAPPAARAAARVFQPPAPALAALGARVKAAFDPQGKLNPGRMG